MDLDDARVSTESVAQSWYTNDDQTVALTEQTQTPADQATAPAQESTELESYRRKGLSVQLK